MDLALDWMEDLTTTKAAELSELEGALQGIKPNMTEDDRLRWIANSSVFGTLYMTGSVLELSRKRWIVGDGTSINVMTDPWLRGKEGAWISSPQIQGAHNITLNELMLPNVKMWDKHKIESLFSLDASKCILNVPLFDTERWEP
ncbi:hypothetical protein L195_g034419 [Trifolium pratense]|uniref:Uncharacterized protein n=1 Tax=Trifolium pratense TaxID=57577 RepID=A0A2K3LIT0_TRIPR|nr:hypothetical protein L195_g034419 [Trifolium pratense]